MTLDLTLTRDVFTDKSTTGVLLWGGLDFGYVLEDVDRGLEATQPLDYIHRTKVAGQTAIPTGRYRVGWNFSPKFQRFTPRLHDVPGFEGIEIHVGNWARDTDGCLLVGLHRVADEVLDSRKAIAWLWPHLSAVVAAGGECWITVQRDPGAWAAREASISSA